MPTTFFMAYCLLFLDTMHRSFWQNVLLLPGRNTVIIHTHIKKKKLWEEGHGQFTSLKVRREDMVSIGVGPALGFRGPLWAQKWR